MLFELLNNKSLSYAQIFIAYDTVHYKGLSNDTKIKIRGWDLEVIKLTRKGKNAISGKSERKNLTFILS